MARVKESFKFRSFSRKQKKVLTWWLTESPVHDKDGIIADGAIRSGKTVSMALSFIIWAMETFEDENLALCGKTIGVFRRNVLKPLKVMLWSRGYTFTDHRTDNLLVVSRGGATNYFYVFGGKDESSQDLIQGLTLAGVFFDEVALMPESFVNQATARCSVEGAKFWFNCNPQSPLHWFKKGWIDKVDEKNLLYLHFTMDDNLSLSERVKERYRALYQGVFFKRYILGLWVAAEGLVFRFLADDQPQYQFEQKKLSDHEIERRRHIYDVKYDRIVMGIDFGGNGSMTTFVVSGYKGWEEIDVIEEDSLPITEAIDSDDICKKFGEVYERTVNEYGHCERALGDNASTTMINTLKSYARENEYDIRVDGCLKNEIIDRAVFKDNMLSTGRMKFEKSCTKVINALSEIRWVGGKEDEIEDKNIDNINDWSDAFDYSWTMYQGYFEKRR